MLAIRHSDARSRLTHYDRQRDILSTSHLLLGRDPLRVWVLKRRMTDHLDQTSRHERSPRKQTLASL